jgi:hypothetical protein
MFSTLPEPEQIKTMANKRGTLPFCSAYGIGELTSGASGGNYLKKCLLTYHTILSHGAELCTTVQSVQTADTSTSLKACCNIFNLYQLLFLRNNSC